MLEKGEKKCITRAIRIWTELGFFPPRCQETIMSPKLDPNQSLEHKGSWNILMAGFRERLEAIHSGSGRTNTSQEGETRDLTNILLLELLQKQNEQM